MIVILDQQLRHDQICFFGRADSKKEPLYVPIKIENRPTNGELDTAATCYGMTTQACSTLGISYYEKTIRAEGAFGSAHFVGCVSTSITIGSITHLRLFHLIRSERERIFLPREAHWDFSLYTDPNLQVTQHTRHGRVILNPRLAPNPGVIYGARRFQPTSVAPSSPFTATQPRPHIGSRSIQAAPLVPCVPVHPATAHL